MKPTLLLCSLVSLLFCFLSYSCFAQTTENNEIIIESSESNFSTEHIEQINYNSSAGKPSSVPTPNEEAIYLTTNKDSLQVLKELCLKSKATWEKLKKEQNKTTYSYKSKFTYKMMFDVTKEVTFEDNDAIALIMHTSKFGDKEFISEEMNVRTKQGGYELKGIRSIDRMYEYCLDELFSMSVAENEIYFGVDKNGIINLYGFVPKNCLDACFEGQSIQEFSWE
jgi:hypothetical protein